MSTTQPHGGARHSKTFLPVLQTPGLASMLVGLSPLVDVVPSRIGCAPIGEGKTPPTGPHRLGIGNPHRAYRTNASGDQVAEVRLGLRQATL